MKNSKLVTFVLLGAVVLAAGAMGFRQYSKVSTGRAAASSSESPAQPASSEKQTPADARIRAGEGKIKVAPDRPDGWNLLASAYMQKARETADFGYNAKADAALRKSFEVAPDNYDALKFRAKLLLTYHRFADALVIARRAADINPRDHDVYGALTDALVELGDYPAAVEAAQKMVDLRPDAQSYARVSYLRSLHGDAEGAIEAMNVAIRAADPRDPEGLAWFRVQLGNEYLNLGRTSEAEAEVEKALRTFPGYRAALDAKARARVAAGDADAAIEIYRSELEQNPESADATLALGELYAKLGRAEEAERYLASYEPLERKNAEAENDWHHLIYFWADHDRNLAEALTLARRAREARADIYTCDALAWALYKNGRLVEARSAIDEATRLGTRDPLILKHAALIYQATGDKEKAATFLRLAGNKA